MTPARFVDRGSAVNVTVASHKLVRLPVGGKGKGICMASASVYMSVQAPLRASFLKRLRGLRVLKRHTVWGVDRNTVADVGLDVQYPASSTTKYPNQIASL